MSSPLARAVQTAEPLARRLGRDLVLDERFGELRVGPWQGYTEDEIAQRWPEEWRVWRTAPHTLEMEGRETLKQLNARVAEALEELFDSLAEGRAAVVFTHDAVVRAGVAWALGTGPEIYRHVLLHRRCELHQRGDDQRRPTSGTWAFVSCAECIGTSHRRLPPLVVPSGRRSVGGGALVPRPACSPPSCRVLALAHGER